MSELDKIVNQLSKLTIIEAANLAKKLEEAWGVTATPSPTTTINPHKTEETNNNTEEKDNYDIVLDSVGEKRIHVIKEVKAITGIGLKEAKELVESSPKIIKNSVSKNEAEIIKVKLESVGAKVSLK